MMRLRPILVLVCFALILDSGYGQNATGELKLHVVDTQGAALPSTVILSSDAAEVRKTLQTDVSGDLDVKHLPFGTYSITVQRADFDPSTQVVQVQSSIAAVLNIFVHPARSQRSISVRAAPTLIDPAQAGSVNRIGQQEIETRELSLPGRGVIDLVNSQPGWLYEGNAVLHPRGSEYQTQFVLNGIPLTENRSPGMGSQLGADDVQSMSIYTAGIPAEYGRKMGGVVEVNTIRDMRPGLHGMAILSGGSFATADGYLFSQYGWGKNSAGASLEGAYTDWYENPPVLQNFTNNATTGNFAGQYQRDFSPKDGLTLLVRHELARFLVPNEQVQETAGQIQHRDTLETIGTLAWQHIFSSHVLANLDGMGRDDTTQLSSNSASTPIIAGQDRGFREGYVKGTITADHDRQEWKAGAEGDFLNLHEQFNYTITDPTQFDPETPKQFNFFQRGRDREQAIFLEDNVHFNNWSVAAGLRWDNYELLVHQNAFSPRVAVSRYVHSADLVAHFSYDRVFQTPAFENLLLSSSPQVVSLDPNVLRLPILPSYGNYYEAGVTKGFFYKLRLDGNYYLRSFRDFADDNPLLDTSIAFPISFRKAVIYGAEGKLEVPHWGRASGFISYSYMVGSAYLPVTGGLFLGVAASQALQQTSGRLWVSQDQRNTLRTRWIYHLPRQVWFAAGSQYGSGLPVEFSGTKQQAIAQYGQALVDRVNFGRGRVLPSFAMDASASVQLWKKNDVVMRLQVDGENLNNRINLIDFAGLFSGNAVGPPRSYGLRLTAQY